MDNVIKEAITEAASYFDLSELEEIRKYLANWTGSKASFVQIIAKGENAQLEVSLLFDDLIMDYVFDKERKTTGIVNLESVTGFELEQSDQEARLRIFSGAAMVFEYRAVTSKYRQKLEAYVKSLLKYRWNRDA